MKRLVVIVNANARRIRRWPAQVDRMRALLRPDDRLYLTRSVSEVDDIARRCADEDAPVIALAGGDGTNHVTITRIARAYGDRPLPRFALLGGGTMNIVAGALGVARRPAAALAALCDLADDAPPLHRNLLRVRADERDVLGFIFGNGLIVNFLREYYQQVDPTPVDAGKLLTATVWSVLRGGELSKRLLLQLTTSLRADAEDWLHQDLIAVMASSQEHLGLGFQPFVRAREQEGAFHAVAIRGPLLPVAGALPAIRLARPLPTGPFEERTPSVLEIRTDQPGPWMVDGDIYPDTRSIRVETGPAIELLVGGAPHHR